MGTTFYFVHPQCFTGMGGSQGSSSWKALTVFSVQLCNWSLNKFLFKYLIYMVCPFLKFIFQVKRFCKIYVDSSPICNVIICLNCHENYSSINDELGREKIMHPIVLEKELISAVCYLVVWIASLFFLTVFWNVNPRNPPVERSRIKLYGPKSLNFQSTVAYYEAMFTGRCQFLLSLMQILKAINGIYTLCFLFIWFYRIV